MTTVLREMTPLERELFRALHEQHLAMHRLFAMLIVAHKEGEKQFFPSQSGQPWEAMQVAHALIERLTR